VGVGGARSWVGWGWTAEGSPSNALKVDNGSGAVPPPPPTPPDPRKRDSLVAPRLELRVHPRRVPVAHPLPVRVKLDRVLIKQVAGRQVAPPTKPRLPGHLKQPHVRAQRRHQRVCRVEHQRQRRGAVGLPALGVDVGAPAGAHRLRALRGELAVDDADVGGRLFEEVAALQDARDAVACRLRFGGSVAAAV